MPFWKEITKPFREVTRLVPGVGPGAAIIVREVARVADNATKPVQEPVKSIVNDLTGVRERENKRLDNQKAQLIREAQQRVAANIQANQQNIRDLIVTEANAVRAEIEKIEKETASEIKVEIDQDIVTNPFFAYDDCRFGRTQDLKLILQLDDDNDTYIFFMWLNPLNEAYLSYIESNINIDAIRMLSEHNHPSIAALKTELSENVWSNIDIAIAEQNFEKIKQIISAFIQFEGEDSFLEQIRRHSQIHQPLINAAILVNNNDNGIVFGELYSSAKASAPKSATAPKPRP